MLFTFRTTQRSFAALAAAAVVALAAAGPAHAGLVTHFDGNFNQADWSVNQALTSGSSTHSATQDTTPGLGNDSPFREMQHDVLMSGTGQPTFVNVRHLTSAFTYNPSVNGAIESIDMTMDAIILSVSSGTTPAVGHAFMLVQDGVSYFYDLHDFTNTSWQTFGFSGLVAADFSTFDGQNPDFSDSGSEIQFGYLRSNTNTGQTGDVHIRHGIDNFGVAITTVPGPATLCAIAFAAVLARPRRRKLSA